MNEKDRRYLTAATRGIEKLLGARGLPPLRPSGLTPELQAFGESFDRLLEQLEAFRRLAISLANGDLSFEAPARQHLLDPLKHLQAHLRHLTWQTQQIAAGDLEQGIDFLGEFSISFNQMIEGLREKRAIEERVRHLSLHDALTGLYNRTYFNEEIARLGASENYPVSFLMADLDGLKTVNDTQGHQVGDLLIQRAARLLEHGIRAKDVLVRLGGDEFTIILYGTDREGANIVSSRIRDTLEAHNQRNQNFPVFLSLGASTADTPSSLEESLRRADQAMYRDKSERKKQSVKN